MTDFWPLVTTFLTGGVILTPLFFIIVTFSFLFWWKSLTFDTSPCIAMRFEPLVTKVDEKPLVDVSTSYNSISGWIRMSKEFKLDHVDSNILSGLMMQGINSLIEGKNASPRRPKDSYFAVLKHETLSLYADEKMLECQGVITLSYYTVSLYPSYLPDNEVFLQDFPIRLKKKVVEESSGKDVKNDYYIFINTSIQKEDWFFALCRASRLKQWGTTRTLFDQNPANFEANAMQLLIERVNVDEHHQETQWLNALLGRIFLSMYKTQAIKDFIIREILLKISKIKRPAFIKEFSVKDLLLGDSIPSVTHPKLIDLNAAGEMSAEFKVQYCGGFGIEINTEMSIVIPPFINTVIPIKLAIRIRRAEGRMLLKVKSPPTNRFWLGFKEDPNISFDIVPIVSNRIMRSRFISAFLESQIRAVLNDIMVLPNMDDTHFFLSDGLGGIFDSAGITEVEHEVVLNTQSEIDEVEDNGASHDQFKTPTKLFKHNQSGDDDTCDEQRDNVHPKRSDESSVIAAQMPSEIPLRDPLGHPPQENTQDTSIIDGLVSNYLPKPPPSKADSGKITSSDDFTLEGGLPNVTAVTRGYAMAKNADLKDSSWWKSNKESKRNSLPSFSSAVHLGEQLKELPLNEKLGKLKLLPSLMSFRNSTWGNKTTSAEQPHANDAISSNHTSKTNTITAHNNSPTLSAITSIFSQNNGSTSSINSKQKSALNVEGSHETASSEPDNSSITSSQSAKFFTSLFSHSSS